MNLFQNCVNTIKRVSSEIHESLQATRMSFQQLKAAIATSEESASCGCGQDMCRLGDDGCKPTSQPITLQEESV